MQFPASHEIRCCPMLSLACQASSSERPSLLKFMFSVLPVLPGVGPRGSSTNLGLTNRGSDNARQKGDVQVDAGGPESFIGKELRDAAVPAPGSAQGICVFGSEAGGGSPLVVLASEQVFDEAGSACTSGEDPCESAKESGGVAAAVEGQQEMAESEVTVLQGAAVDQAAPGPSPARSSLMRRPPLPAASRQSASPARVLEFAFP